MNDLKLIGFLIAAVGAAFSISLCSVGIGIYAAALFLSFLTERESLPAYPHFRWLALLFVCLAVSLFTSPFFWVSLKGLGKFLEGFLLFYAGRDIFRNEKNFRFALLVLGGIYALAALAAISQDVFGRDFIYFRQAIMVNELERIRGPYKHSNDFGSFLVPALPIVAAFLCHGMRGRRRAWFFCGTLLLAILCYALWKTMSRSAVAAAFFSLCVFSLFFPFRKKALVGAALIATVVVFVPSTLGERFWKLAALGDTAPERLLLLKTTFRMIESRPFFGLGLNTYSENFERFRPANYPGLMYAHNGYTQMAAEIGLVGIFLYVFFIGLCLKDSVTAARTEKQCLHSALLTGVIAGIAGLLFNAFFESLFQSTQLRTLFWLLMGLAASSGKIFSRP